MLPHTCEIDKTKGTYKKKGKKKNFISIANYGDTNPHYFLGNFLNMSQIYCKLINILYHMHLLI